MVGGIFALFLGPLYEIVAHISMVCFIWKLLTHSRKAMATVSVSIRLSRSELPTKTVTWYFPDSFHVAYVICMHDYCAGQSFPEIQIKMLEC